jgi:hypothetical protein
MIRLYKKTVLVIFTVLMCAKAFAQCTPTGAGCCGIGISQVKVGDDLNNFTPTSVIYTDYSATLSASGYAGQSLSYAIQNGGGYDLYMGMWINWNGNGTFEAAEQVVSSYAPGGTLLTGTITVPTGTPAGNYRMRVGGGYFGGSFNSCGATYGDFEDYTFTVLPTAAMAYSTVEMTHPHYVFDQIANTQTNVPVLRAKILTTGNINPLVLNNLSFSPAGTTNVNDITMYHLYSGPDSVFANATQIASSSDIGTLTFSPITFPVSSNHYFWLTIDMNPMAAFADGLDAGINSISFNAMPDITPSPVSPAGHYVIVNDLAPYGNNVWNVHAYNGFSFDTYRGYYTQPGIDFNTTLDWDPNDSPSSAAGYIGDAVDADYFSWQHKRQGFPDKIYSINIDSHDDVAGMYINETQVFYHNSCCDSHTDIWHGILNDTTKVRFEVQEYNGGANGAASFHIVTPDIISVNTMTAAYHDNIQISGNYFYGIDAVQIGGSNVESFVVVDEHTITAVVGCNAPGDVKILSHYGNDSLSGFDFTYSTWYADADADGFGDNASPLYACVQPVGSTTNNTDCDDTDASVNPNKVWFADADGDNYGDPASTLVQCTQPSGYVDDNTDCYDNNAAINPATIWYADGDGDNYGDATVMLTQCTQPLGYVNNNTDCNDNNSAVTPNLVWFADGDNDGFGDAALTLTECIRPAGYVADNTDCDDNNAAINPNTQWFEDYDNDGYGNPVGILTQCTQPLGYVANNSDCDDNNSAVTPNLVWFADADGDNYGDAAVTLTQCMQPAGYVADNTDCDDSNAAHNPNTTWFADADNDGFGDPAVTLTQCDQPLGYLANNADCDDNNAAINPNTQWFADADNDGFGDPAQMQTQCFALSGYVLNANDCDDNNNAIGQTLAVAFDLGTSLICNDNAYTLTGGAPSGGIYSGTQVTGDQFDPTGITGEMIFTYTVTNGTCTSAATDTLTVSVCTDVAAINGSQSISIYPNPSTGSIRIDAGKEQHVSAICVTGLNGNVVYTEKNPAPDPNNTYSIDLNNCREGIYFVKISTNKTIKTVKVSIIR